jgi:micrococcal nuclease
MDAASRTAGVILLLFASCLADTDADEVSVTRVVDGDTFRAVVSGREEPIRLIGVDTPEVPWYGGPDGCFGEEAALYASRRLDGRAVRLEFDVERRDRYGRLLAYVFLERELINLTLLRHGFATALAVSPNLRRQALFEAAEEAARETGTGLWSACPASDR